MQLKELLKTINYTEIINRSGIDMNSIQIQKLSSHSKDANQNCIFVCIVGSLVDGHKYAHDAYERGCRVFVAQRELTNIPDDALTILVKDSRIALAKLSAAYFDYPASKMTLIGITGTKGKTTAFPQDISALTE